MLYWFHPIAEPPHQDGVFGNPDACVTLPWRFEAAQMCPTQQHRILDMLPHYGRIMPVYHPPVGEITVLIPHVAASRT
jgi:hypothetical protein